jgi:hypothetical protein
MIRGKTEGVLTVERPYEVAAEAATTVSRCLYRAETAWKASPLTHPAGRTRLSS